MLFDEDVITELDHDQCWAALRADEFGPLAYRLGDEVSIPTWCSRSTRTTRRTGPTGHALFQLARPWLHMKAGE